VAGHQPPPAPQEPLAGPLSPLAPREPPIGPRRPPAPWAPPAGPLQPSATGPHHSKPQERPHVCVERWKCPANKNNDKIYQMK
jgi:hypothetical protein